MSARLLIAHALSPLHAGTGQSVGAIDLAIARDRATHHPYVPGSSLKGALRARAVETLTKQQAWDMFGPDTQNASDHAGALVFGDANLLLLPVRSVAGTFAWATSPYLLMRFARDAAEAGVNVGAIPPAPVDVAICTVCPGTALAVSVGGAPKVVFEDLDFEREESETLKPLAKMLADLIFPGDAFWTDLLEKRLCVVHDDVMSFLSRNATDVVARVKLQESQKTVEHLWYEESLPTESILNSLVIASPNGRRTEPASLMGQLEGLAADVLQLGGKGTVGRGRCRITLSGGNDQ